MRCFVNNSEIKLSIYLYQVHTHKCQYKRMLQITFQIKPNASLLMYKYYLVCTLQILFVNTAVTQTKLFGEIYHIQRHFVCLRTGSPLCYISYRHTLGYHKYKHIVAVKIKFWSKHKGKVWVVKNFSISLNYNKLWACNSWKYAAQSYALRLINR